MRILPATPWAATALLLAALGTAAWRLELGKSFEQRCATLPASSVDVQVEPGVEGEILPFTASAVDVREVPSASLHEEPRTSVTAGYVSMSLASQRSVQVTYKKDRGSAAICFTMQAKVRVVQSAMSIYVADALAREGCGHREVLAHERRHIELYRQLAGQWHDELARELPQRLGAGPFRVQAGATTVAEHALQRIDDILTPLARAATARWEALHKETIDTDAEYERFSQACDGEIARALEPARRAFELRRMAQHHGR